MRRTLVCLAGVILAAATAAADVGWTGNSVVYANGTWYNCSGSWGSGAFNNRDFGVLTALVLGANASTWWTDSGSHRYETVVEMGFNVDGTGDHYLALPWLDYGFNNDRWEQMTGVDVFAYLGAGTDHYVDVWFRATGGGNTVWDSNNSANYKAFFTTIPEPAATALLALGAACLALRRRTRG